MIITTQSRTALKASFTALVLLVASFLPWLEAPVFRGLPFPFDGHSYTYSRSGEVVTIVVTAWNSNSFSIPNWTIPVGACLVAVALWVRSIDPEENSPTAAVLTWLCLLQSLGVVANLCRSERTFGFGLIACVAACLRLVHLVTPRLLIPAIATTVILPASFLRGVPESAALTMFAFLLFIMIWHRRLPPIARATGQILGLVSPRRPSQPGVSEAEFDSLFGESAIGNNKPG